MFQWPARAQEHQTVPARVDAPRERRHARPCLDRELVPEFWDLIQHGAVVAGVCDEEDRTPAAEIPLLAAESSNRGLDVVEARLRLQDAVEAMPVDDAVRAPLIAWDRNGNFRAPTQ